MPIIWTIAKKELKELFTSPIAYVFLTLFLFLSFWFFFSGLFPTGQASVRPLFTWLPILLLIFLPAVTMSSWSQEKKSGTLEILLTLPLHDWEVTLGKFLASFIFLAIALSLTTPACLTVSLLGNLDGGMVTAGYLGLLFLGAGMIALGLFVSSLTENQVVAFIGTTVLLFIFYLMRTPLVFNFIPQSLTPLFSFLSLNGHYESMARGVIDSRDVFYDLSFMGFFIYLNLLSLESRRWE